MEMMVKKYGWLRSNFLKGRLWGEKKKTLKGPNNIKKLGYLFFYYFNLSIHVLHVQLFKNKLRNP